MWSLQITAQPISRDRMPQLQERIAQNTHSELLFKKQTGFRMLKNGKVVMPHLFANTLGEKNADMPGAYDDLDGCKHRGTAKNMMFMHKYKYQYADTRKIIVDIPKRPQFSETSVWRCKQQAGEGQALADEAPKFRCWFLPAGLWPWAGKGPTCVHHSYGSASTLNMNGSFLSEVQLWEMNRQVTTWENLWEFFYHFFPKSVSLRTKQNELI